jgi:starch-binding outer membrane protein, SusD/RagB family
MSERNHIKRIAALIAGTMLMFGCKKEFLDKKPSSDLVVPRTLGDFQALLDNDAVMSETPALGELSGDNYYLDSNFWQSLDPKQHNAYIWSNDLFAGVSTVEDWDISYQQVFYANVVLDGLPGIAVDNTNRQSWNTEKGEACFIRAYAFWNVAQIFAPAYDSMSAVQDRGIALRLTSDINPAVKLSSVKQTYDQIIGDLKLSTNLLPDTVPREKLNRPSKPAAFAMLARVFLSMRDYPHALAYADSCLQTCNRLMEYDTLRKGIAFPFDRSNVEVLYQSHLLTSSNALWGLFYYFAVDTILYNSYDSNDLRKILYYTTPGANPPTTKGSYNTSIYGFSGLAVDEMYLIRAECYARRNNILAALSDLNKLMMNRWAGVFTPYTTGSSSDALTWILTERRKELAFRGLRWTDLRRFNKDGTNSALTRVVDGITYTLSVGDPRYVLPIPPDVKPIGN